MKAHEMNVSEYKLITDGASCKLKSNSLQFDDVVALETWRLGPLEKGFPSPR